MLDSLDDDSWRTGTATLRLVITVDTDVNSDEDRGLVTYTVAWVVKVRSIVVLL